MITAEQINDRNHRISAEGEVVGHVVRHTIGPAPGWYFVAAHKRLSNRYPDSTDPAPTWHEAMPR